MWGEAFIGLVHHEEQVGGNHVMKVAQAAPTITNLFLADHTMIFCEATMENVNALSAFWTPKLWFGFGTTYQLRKMRRTKIMSCFLLPKSILNSVEK